MRVWLAALLLGWCGAGIAEVKGQRPNIVVLLVDDAAYMDFGGYGGEAKTPAIDALGDAGVRFSNYHTSPLCAPSRAMLLTGLDNHRAGVATIPEVLTPEQEGQAGYELTFATDVLTIADKLRQTGYRTLMTGKWHLGDDYDSLPVSHGFDRSFALAASGADNFEKKSYMPYYKTAPWFEDGVPADLPADFYSSKFIVDRMIDYIEGSTSDSPFFAYMAFQAIHIPLQAPREFIERYEGVYDNGWDSLRQTRWEQARALGLIDKNAPLPGPHSALDAWDDLSAEHKAFYARSMEVNAAMLEAMDFHVERFVEFLRATGQFDNTVFVVTSDNGPEFNEPTTQPAMRLWMALNGYNRNLETLGEKGSIAHIGPEWAYAAASPGRLFKFYPSEGGLRVPLIVSGPGVPARPGFVDAFTVVTDITPTLLELADVPVALQEKGKSMDGRSLVPLLTGIADSLYDDETAVTIEVSGNVAVFMGRYKLLKVTPPYGEDTWQLFDIESDPGETRDLATDQSQIFSKMMLEYEAYAERVGVISPGEGFNPLQRVAQNSVQKQLSYYGHYYALALLLLIVLLIGGARLLYGLVRPKG